MEFWVLSSASHKSDRVVHIHVCTKEMEVQGSVQKSKVIFRNIVSSRLVQAKDTERGWWWQKDLERHIVNERQMTYSRRGSKTQTQQKSLEKYRFVINRRVAKL